MTIPMGTLARELVCVSCRAPLAWPAPDRAACTACQKSYPVDSGVIRMSDAFDAVNAAGANFYDSPLWKKVRFWEQVFFWFHGGENRARKQYMKFFNPQPGQRIAVAAIGVGSELKYMPVECPVVGLDISIVQLRKCAEHAAKRDLTLILGEAEHWPMPDKSVDHTQSGGGFNYFSDMVGSLREMVRITKVGGSIVVSDEIPKAASDAQQKKHVRKVIEGALGDEFSKVVIGRGMIPLNDVFNAAFSNWQMHSIWRGSGYCAVATVTEADHAALQRPAPTLTGNAS